MLGERGEVGVGAVTLGTFLAGGYDRLGRWFGVEMVGIEEVEGSAGAYGFLLVGGSGLIILFLLRLSSSLSSQLLQLLVPLPPPLKLGLQHESPSRDTFTPVQLLVAASEKSKLPLQAVKGGSSQLHVSLE